MFKNDLSAVPNHAHACIKAPCTCQIIIKTFKVNPWPKSAHSTMFTNPSLNQSDTLQGYSKITGIKILVKWTLKLLEHGESRKRNEQLYVPTYIIDMWYNMAWILQNNTTVQSPEGGGAPARKDWFWKEKNTFIAEQKWIPRLFIRKYNSPDNSNFIHTVWQSLS